MRPVARLACAASLAGVFELQGCSLGSGAPPLDPGAGQITQPAIVTGAGKIEHVVYVVQENRSFDDLFQGYPGADTASSGENSYGQRVKLQPVSLKTPYEIDHSAAAMFVACDGSARLPGTDCRMNGFNREHLYGGPRNGQYAYVPHKETKPYFDIAHEWVLADKTFASQLDESFVAHQYVIAAQAESSVDVPFSLWGCPGGPGDSVEVITRRREYGGSQRPCFDYQTLGDELDAAGLPWRFYTSQYTVPFGGLWSGYQAV
ncbi:MAG: hypothetical protein JO113_04635, partial [Candidatus Eremiobacteraeota bacterium]|nr:hypothetical protein [Candidatus Eremiobacteraeota bacterium]